MPRLLGWPQAADPRPRVDELLELVGLDPAQFGRRYPHELSGGQRQRVGVARALAADPVVLLMDEPFSAVDPIVRARLQEEFLRLQAEVRKTIVLVTHDLDEAVRLGDRIAVLSEGGRLEQYDTPAALLGAPANAFVARVRRRGPGHPAARGHPGHPGGARRRRRPPTPPCRNVPLGRSAYDALAAMLTAGADAVLVTARRPAGRHAQPRPGPGPRTARQLAGRRCHPVRARSSGRTGSGRARGQARPGSRSGAGSGPAAGQARPPRLASPMIQPAKKP